MLLMLMLMLMQFLISKKNGVVNFCVVVTDLFTVSPVIGGATTMGPKKQPPSKHPPGD